MKSNFSIPKIYTGGLEITEWESYSKEQQSDALKKNWYIYYSFRHTFITRLYRKLRETNSQQIVKSELLLITGHSTITALDKYLRDIDAKLSEDYSHFFK